MVICEAPGRDELKALEPLVGSAGKLFNNFLREAGLKRSDLFLANTVNCVDLEREDRRPLPAEKDACRPRLLSDIHAVQPKVIIAMGNIAQELFFPGSTVSKVRGHIRTWNKIPVIATYHPSYALPHRNPQCGPLIVEDLKLALSFL